MFNIKYEHFRTFNIYLYRLLCAVPFLNIIYSENISSNLESDRAFPLFRSSRNIL